MGCKTFLSILCSVVFNDISCECLAVCCVGSRPPLNTSSLCSAGHQFKNLTEQSGPAVAIPWTSRKAHVLSSPLIFHMGPFNVGPTYPTSHNSDGSHSPLRCQSEHNADGKSDGKKAKLKVSYKLNLWLKINKKKPLSLPQ